MATSIARVRILVVRTWTESLAPLRDALHSAGIDARIVRVDFKAALDAALVRGDFDVIVYDHSTPAIPRALLDTRMREHRRTTPVVTASSVDDIVEAVRHVAHRLLN